MGGDLLARVVNDAMKALVIDRRGVVDRIGPSTRRRSEWFQALDRLRAGGGATARQIELIGAALDLDLHLLQSAAADDEGEQLDRYLRWERWAWEPTVPDHLFEVLSKGYGRSHPLPSSITREAALLEARELVRRSGHWVAVPAFQSQVARLCVPRTGREHYFYVGFGVPDDEADRFQLRRRALREPPHATRSGSVRRT